MPITTRSAHPDLLPAAQGRVGRVKRGIISCLFIRHGNKLRNADSFRDTTTEERAVLLENANIWNVQCTRQPNESLESVST